MKERLWLIDLPYACYGIVSLGGRVTMAPPIARWMTGKNIATVLEWVERKGGTHQQV